MRDAGTDARVVHAEVEEDGTDKGADAGATTARAVEIAEPSRRRTANRRNARLSTGPRSVEGKKRSRGNALTHGILARATVLPSVEGKEAVRQFRKLMERLWVDLAPATALEEMLVERAASCCWRLGRVVRAETEALQPAVDDAAVELELEHRQRAQELREDESIPAAERLRDLPGVESIIEMLAWAVCEIERNEFLDRDGIEAFQNVVGNVFIDGMEEPESPLSRKEKRARRHEALAALGRLQEEMESLRNRLVECANRERERARRPLAVPPDPIGSRLLRYEAAIERQFYKALHELERLQRARRGESLPPRIQVDLES